MSKSVRYKTVQNIDWNVWETDDGKYMPDQVQRAILMDIREELNRLNKVMQCPNVAAGFRALAAIARDEKRFQQAVRRAIRRELKKRAKK